MINHQRWLVPLLLLAMAGCSSFSSSYNPSLSSLYPLPQRSQLAYANNVSLGFPALTKDNYRQVLSQRRSGVYQHPFYRGEIVTLLFDLDETRPAEIGALQLDHDFEKQRCLIRSAFQSGHSASAMHVLLAYRGRIDSNVVAFHPNLPSLETDLQAHRRYFLLMHEVAHSLHSQSQALRAKRSMTELENFSDIVATILLYQLMMQEQGTWDDFLATLNIERSASDVALISHRTNHVFTLLTELIEYNQRRFMHLSYPEIESFAADLAFAFANHDYGEPHGVQDITSVCYLKWKGNADYFMRVAAPTLDKFKLNYTLSTKPRRLS